MAKQKHDFLTKAGTVLAVVIPLFTLFVGYKKLIEERPNLVVQIEHVKLNGFVHPDTIWYELEEIEQQYGLATGNNIRQLQAAVKSANSQFLDTVQVQRILVLLFNNIRFFQMPPPAPWTFDKIKFIDGVVTWPDGATYDITRDPAHAATIFGAAPALMSDEKVKRTAHTLYQPYKVELREAITNKLRLIRTKLYRLANQKSHFLELQLRVINNSSRPNVLMRATTYSIQVTDSAGQAEQIIPLTFSNESVVGGMSEAHMTLQSKVALKLAPVDLHKLFSGKKSLSTILTFRAAQGGLWKVPAQVDVENGQADIADGVGE